MSSRQVDPSLEQRKHESKAIIGAFFQDESTNPSHRLLDVGRLTMMAVTARNVYF